MKEKAYQQEYSYFAPQATFTRVANKMLKDAEEVFGAGWLYDDIKAVAEHIKKQENCEPYDYEHSHSYDVRGDQYGSAYTCKSTDECHIFVAEDDDEYGDPIYFVRWYFFTVDTYTANIGGKKIADADFEKFMRKQMEAKGEYRYFCIHRPPSLGVIPDAPVSFESYGPHNRYLGEVTYNREITAEEAGRLGLVYDFEYAKRRAYWLEGKNET